MTTNVKIFRSTDAGASAFTVYGSIPASTGSAGSLIGVLRACLITGYNSVTATSVTVASNIATFNYTAHGFLVGQCLLIAGATPSGLNGEMYVTSVLTDSFTFAAPGITNQTATGTITAKMAPAGWTEPYAATTNVTCFKQGGGNQFYINLDETTAQGARVAGFETMIAVGIANGSGSFPTPTQVSGGLYWTKSSAISTTVRNWVIIATDRVIYVHINTDGNTTSGGASSLHTMGDLKTYRAGDAYGTVLIGNEGGLTSNMGIAVIVGFTSIAGHYLPRNHTQLGSSVQGGKGLIDPCGNTSSFMGANTLTFPYPVDNGLWMSPIRVCDGTINTMRGELPGLWSPLHSKPLNHLDIFTGSGNLTGKTFITLNAQWSNSYPGQCMVEISNTWSI